MDSQKPAQHQEESLLGTLAWVGVVALCAVVALTVLALLGPSGG